MDETIKTSAGFVRTLFGALFCSLCLIARIDLWKNDISKDEFTNTCQGTASSNIAAMEECL